MDALADTRPVNADNVIQPGDEDRDIAEMRPVLGAWLGAVSAGRIELSLSSSDGRDRTACGAHTCKPPPVRSDPG
jgi:hypothetical protein